MTRPIGRVDLKVGSRTTSAAGLRNQLPANRFSKTKQREMEMAGSGSSGAGGVAAVAIVVLVVLAGGYLLLGRGALGGHTTSVSLSTPAGPVSGTTTTK
jgi:hypothetical protein